MNKIYYIADMHCGHKNVIKFDSRPFKSVGEMDKALINNWNSVVDNLDAVYILGDFCWDKEDRWIEVLKQLKGKKYLILGNHDLKRLTPKVKGYFSGIYDYREIKDNGRRVILCHYPIPFYKNDYNPDVYHLYGHIHVTIENDFMEKIKKMIQEEDTRDRGKHMCQFYNVGCMMPWMGYTPRTLDEIIEGVRKHDEA